ncbi:hypothetical protein B0H17DRAFT_1028256 [Mycena rosella]|uniref:EH domain-containing protein n=1 Tax=Mycena rosella TaxID=1033263 RepID=A0AAD7MBP1_MYCRO|nr:hypothetical protein B0H17DRAFT_1028256 [Mycena rosella]
MPANSLQSRISAFESLSSPSQRPVLQTPISPRVIPSTPPRGSPSPSPPNLGRKSSLIDLKIDLKDWVLDDGSPPRSNSFKNTPTQAAFNRPDDALIHFSPPKPSSVKAPPLPPRKPSLSSLKSNASTASLPLAKRSPVLPPPTRRGDSLTVEHTYPPPGLPLDLSSGRGHSHGSSISSFHSVSLSDGSPSPGTTVFPQHATGSSAESFEELSASAALASPATSAIISHDWEQAMARRKPPKLPARPVVLTVSPPPARRTAPPPPSDRASIRSVASASSSASASTSKSATTPALTARPPPVPPAPRSRYDALFSSLLAAHAQRPALLASRRRTAAGWRGLSVDLIRDPGHPSPPQDDDGDTLPGAVIRVLWARSRLPLPVLSSIWTECDPGRTGALDRDAFARGMWRIDEELRRAAATSTTGGARRRGLR